MKIRLGSRVIFETFDHYVLKIDLNDYKKQKNELLIKRITRDNMNEVGRAVGNTTGKWIESNYPFVEGYCFSDADGRQIGSCWVMFKGGDEKLYKVRKCDSFIFRLEVMEQYRGHGYSKMIMDHMMKVIGEHGCSNMALVCAAKNKRALNLYEGIGMKKCGRRVFVRIGNRNVPYYSL